MCIFFCNFVAGNESEYMSTKKSIRFYNDHMVRAVWSDEENKWYFSVLDIVGAINEQDDYQKNRNYWKLRSRQNFEYM